MEYWKIPYSPAEIKGTASLVPNKKAEGGGGGGILRTRGKGKKEEEEEDRLQSARSKGKEREGGKKRDPKIRDFGRGKNLFFFPGFFLRFANNNIPFLFSQTLVYTRERMNKIRERSES